MGSPAGFEGARQSHAPRGNRPEAMRIWLLGSLRVSVGSRSIEPDAWRLKKAAALVKLLALAPGHRMPMGELAQKSVLFSRRSGLRRLLKRLEAEVGAHRTTMSSQGAQQGLMRRPDRQG